MVAPGTRSFLVALSGGIASGKTVVANEFALLGVSVFDTDQIARDVVEPGQPALAKIVHVFGGGVLDTGGRLDRKKMRAIVFADPSLRKALESITHPAIRSELTRRTSEASGVYKIHVIPLLVETGNSKTYDRVLIVDCPEELQIARVMRRDNSDETTARKILAAQASREQRVAIADDVIENTGDLTSLRTQVRVLHERYLKIATGA